MNAQPSIPQQPGNSEATRTALHARAGQSSDEFRKTLLTLSGGAVGVFFVTLTGKGPVELTSFERLLLLGALVAFALAIGFALLAFEYAGRTFHDKAEHYAAYTGANHEKMLYYHNALLCFFAIGVIISGLYLCILIATK